MAINHIDGTSGNDVLVGGADVDYISGKAGNDTLSGGDGADTLSGDAGDDILNGDGGNDFLQLRDGGDDVAYGGAGDDTIWANSDTNSSLIKIYGGDGGDDVVLFSNVGQTNFLVDLGAGSDMLSASDLAGTLKVNAGAGDDVLRLNRTGVEVSLGADHDIVRLDAFPQMPIGTNLVTKITDFQVTGASSDRLDILSPLLYLGWNGTTSPFTAGLVRLVQDGADTLVQLKLGQVLPGQDGYYAVIRLVGVQASTLTAASFNGLDPVGGANAPGVTLIGSGQTDHLVGTVGADLLQGGDGADVLDGGGGDDILQGGAGDDILQPSGGGNDSLSGGDGKDTLRIIGGARHGDHYTLNGDAGDDFLEFNGFYADVTAVLSGGEGSDVIRVLGPGGAQVSGGGGDDFIDGGVGNDVIDGGTTGESTIATQTWQGAGDTLSYLMLNGGVGVTVSLAITFTQNTGGAGADLISNFENLQGSNYDDLLTGDDRVNMIYGGDGIDVIFGNGGADTLQGANGDDELDGGAGADRLIGGLGNDIYVIDVVGDVVVEAANEGIDTVRSGIDYVLGANVEKLTLLGSALTGKGNSLDNQITGNIQNNRLEGGEGADTLDGGFGADTLIGSLGDDAYWVDNAGDVVTELAGEGFDVVISSINYVLSANVEQLSLYGAAVYGVGNAGDNRLTGNALGNTLDGGAGADTLVGGFGDDAYWVDNVGDVVTEVTGQGFDTVASYVSYTLSNNVEQLILVGTAANATGNNDGNMLIGNASGNILTGLDGDDVMAGNGGLDTMIGGRGDDAYWVGSATDVIAELAGEGYDSVAAFVSYTLSANLEQLVLLGSAAYGIGNASANTLTGNALNNVLDGQGGADRLVGGLGDDAYWVDNVGDVVVELAGEGFDTIASFVSYTLAANIEQLKLVGTVALTATGSSSANILNGNDLDNTLYGLGGDDVLAGEAGADTMIGGIGNDAYWVDNVGDVIVELAGEGFESVASSVSYTLSANLEQLVLLGAAVSATGNATGNVLTGNALDNTITGGGGNDILAGGAGADTFVFGPGSGHDRVTDFGLGGAHDVLNLSAFTGTGVTWTVTQQGANTVVAFSNGDDILLDGVIASHVTTQGASLIWN